MQYTDKELADWWTAKSGFEKAELFQKILDTVDENDSFWSMIKDWKRRADNHMSLSPKQLACLRKWDR